MLTSLLRGYHRASSPTALFAVHDQRPPCCLFAASWLGAERRTVLKGYGAIANMLSIIDLKVIKNHTHKRYLDKSSMFVFLFQKDLNRH